MTSSLWNQAAETWSATGASPGTIGLEFTVSTAGLLGGLWLYSPSGEGLTGLPATVGLYTVSGSTLVTSTAASWSGAAGSGWVYAALSSPPALTAGTSYMAAAYGAAASFGYDSSYSWPVSNAPVTGVNGGYYATAGSLAYPSSQQTGWNWWLDVSVAFASPVPVRLIPPGIASPMAFKRHSWPSMAPPLVAVPQAGSGADAGSVTAGIASADAGSAADTATGRPGASDTDTGSGADASAVTATVSPADAGSGTESVAIRLGSADTGTGTETVGVTVRPLLTVRWNAPDKLSKSGGTMGGT